MNELEGIIQAIEMESRRPAPSHNELARLTARALRVIQSALDNTAEKGE